MTLLVGIEPARQHDLLELMRLGDEFTLALYPPGSSHLLSVDDLEQPGVTVFVARDEAALLGMTALVDGGSGIAELKRMFVLPSARGAGVGAALIAALEAHARAARVSTVQLETGPLQPDAIRLYERSGYRLIPNFGKYVGDPNSVCYEKTLG
jgi:putative acetyltransferase